MVSGLGQLGVEMDPGVGCLRRRREVAGMLHVVSRCDGCLSDVKQMSLQLLSMILISV